MDSMLTTDTALPRRLCVQWCRSHNYMYITPLIPIALNRLAVAKCSEEPLRWLLDTYPCAQRAFAIPNILGRDASGLSYAVTRLNTPFCYTGARPDDVRS